MIGAEAVLSRLAHKIPNIGVVACQATKAEREPETIAGRAAAHAALIYERFEQPAHRRAVQPRRFAATILFRAAISTVSTWLR